MKYRKKPVVIDAILYDGNNQNEVTAFVGRELEWKTCSPPWPVIPTLEGRMTAKVGDYIIRGIKGECYPCKPDIFEQSYELVEAS